MIKQRLRLLDTEAIAMHYGVAPGTIRRWAHDGHWTPYGTRRHRLWNLTEIEAWRQNQHSQKDQGTCA